MRKTTELKQLLKAPDPLVMPGAHDAFSALLIEQAGFKAIQASGFGISASLLGKPDVALVSFGEMVDQTRRMVNAVNIPIMGDGDTGFGNAVNVYRTVKEFEAAGAAGINLEDQLFPKRCGHMEGKQLISMEEMVGKIKAAVDARTDQDFIINARTDAIAVINFEEAIKRGKAYAEAGADLIFVEAPQTPEQIRTIAQELNAPISINLFDGVVGGRTPIMTIQELKELGVARVSIPVGVAFAAMKGMKNYLKALAENGVIPNHHDLVVPFQEWKETIGLPQYKKMEKQYLPQEIFKDKYK